MIKIMNINSFYMKSKCKINNKINYINNKNL